MPIKPYYKVDVETKNRIIKLVTTCRELDLGNVSFSYYETPKTDAVDFYISQRKDYWEVVVSSHYESRRDAYRVAEESLIYDYSEQD